MVWDIFCYQTTNGGLLHGPMPGKRGPSNGGRLCFSLGALRLELGLATPRPMGGMEVGVWMVKVEGHPTVVIFEGNFNGFSQRFGK